MENNHVKLNLHRLKSIILQNKYYKKINNNEKESNILLLMNKYIKNLKEIDLIYTMADIEAIKYDNTSYPDTLYTNEMINRFNFYSIILGYIDGNIDNINNKYNNKEINNILLTLINFREKVLNDLKNNTCISDSKILIDTTNKIPCYKNFLECFSNISNNKYSDKNNLKIIISYTIGYINFDKFKFYEIYNEYLKLIDQLCKHKKEKKEIVKKTKIKKNNK